MFLLPDCVPSYALVTFDRHPRAMLGGGQRQRQRPRKGSWTCQSLHSGKCQVHVGYKYNDPLLMSSSRSLSAHYFANSSRSFIPLPFSPDFLLILSFYFFVGIQWWTSSPFARRCSVWLVCHGFMVSCASVRPRLVGEY